MRLIFAALVVLAAMAMPAAADEVDDLILDLKYGTPDVRESAASALGEIGDTRAVDPLIEALKDEYSRVRSSAARALGEIGDPKAVDPLTEALKDEYLTYMASSGTHETVREAASEALKKIQGEPPEQAEGEGAGDEAIKNSRTSKFDQFTIPP